MEGSLKHIVIVGGGTSGWMAASCFAKMLTPLNIKVTLVESSEIGTVGVGEATIPPILDFLRLLEIDEDDFVRATQATFKLAIRFVDWRELGQSYWHQFGTVGANIDGIEFYQHWLKSKRFGNAAEFTDYSPAIVMAKSNKFSKSVMEANQSLAGAKYALHFDASLVAAYLRQYAEQRGVRRIDARVASVTLANNGFIEGITLEGGELLTADFFVDCSGFRGILIEEGLATGYEDWSRYLPCDTAVVVQTANSRSPSPYTQSRALANGWQWRIPLQHRTGNGYVFSSRYTDSTEAEHLFRQNLMGDVIGEPRFVHFLTGKRKKFWNKNCVAVGLASGFLEPLESTSIHLAMKAIIKFVELLPVSVYDCLATANEYNRILDAEYRSIRDFIILHYCTTKRTDTEFWQACANMEIPGSLAERLDLFMSQGRLYRDEFDLFTSNSWYAVLDGMGLRPRGYDPLVNLSNYEEVERMMSRAFQVMHNSAEFLPNHTEFIEFYRTGSKSGDV